MDYRITTTIIIRERDYQRWIKDGLQRLLQRNGWMDYCEKKWMDELLL